MDMYSKLTLFLVENNYASDERTAQKILNCASKEFYDYILESSAQLAQLRRQIQDIEQRNPNDSRLQSLRQRHSELASQSRVSATERVPELRQQRKQELRQRRETMQTSSREQAIRSAGEKVLADMLGREASPTPRTPASVTRGPSTWVGGGASKPRDPIRTARTPGTNLDYVNPTEPSDTRQHHTYTRGDRQRSQGGSTTRRFTNK
jgi:hypothetical protein